MRDKVVDDGCGGQSGFVFLLAVETPTVGGSLEPSFADLLPPVVVTTGGGGSAFAFVDFFGESGLLFLLFLNLGTARRARWHDGLLASRADLLSDERH